MSFRLYDFEDLLQWSLANTVKANCRLVLRPWLLTYVRDFDKIFSHERLVPNEYFEELPADEPTPQYTLLQHFVLEGLAAPPGPKTLKLSQYQKSHGVKKWKGLLDKIPSRPLQRYLLLRRSFTGEFSRIADCYRVPTLYHLPQELEPVPYVYYEA